jgi:hypothetical protein
MKFGQPATETLSKTPREYYENLLAQALKEMQPGSAMIIGPLGIGSAEFKDNLERMHATQKTVAEKYMVLVFDQTKYLDDNFPDAPRDYDLKFEVFYQGLILSGKIKTLYVMKNYETSPGTAKEISYAKEHGVPLVYLD